MAAETGGRSATADSVGVPPPPAAASAVAAAAAAVAVTPPSHRSPASASPLTAASPTPSQHSSDALDSSAHFRGVPTAVPSFFANPFVTPFMPQQFATVPSPSHANGPDCRANSLPPDGYIMQSVQYQEMMQQYIQGLVAAAASFPQTVDPATANQEQPMGDGVWDMQSAAAALPMLLQQMQQHLCFAAPFQSPAPSAMFQPGKASPPGGPLADTKLERSARSSVSDVAENCVVAQCLEKSSLSAVDAVAGDAEGEVSYDDVRLSEKETSGSAEADANAVASSISCPKSDEMPEANDVPETSTSEAAKHQGYYENAQEGDASAVGSSLNVTPTRSVSPSYSEHAEQNARQPPDAAPQNSAGECRTSVLIKKQMNEIDKEISRRIQNKNIKKAALPFGVAGDAAKTVDDPQQLTPSLNELRNAYGAVQGRPTLRSMHQALYQNHFPQQGGVSPLGVQPQVPSGTNVPQMAHPAAPFPHLSATQFPPYFTPSQAVFFPGSQQEVTPQLAAAFLQQFQQGQQMGMFTPSPFPFSEPAYPTHPAPFFPHDAQRADTALGGSATASGPQTPSAVAGGPQKPSASCIPPPPVAPSSNTSRVSAPLNGQINSQHPSASNTSTTGEQWREESGWNEIGARHKPATTAGAQPERSEATDEGEPIWVMRDSYLKRIQREEDRSNESVEAQRIAEKAESAADENVAETERLLAKAEHGDDEVRSKKASKKEVIVHEPAVLIEGVLFRARYLGSTQLICEGRPTKTSRMMQAQEAVARVKAPAGEIQPSTDIDLFISTEKIMVLNTDLQDILMDHALRTISYIADIGDLVVLMARRMSQSASEEECTADGLESVRRAPRVICHVFESDEASFIAQSIGQAFQVAYVEFLRANGIDDPSYLREIDYQEVLNSQELMGEELEMFARKESQKDVVVPKKAGEPLGVVVVESGWGSMLPTVVIANLQPGGAASRCNQLNIGDQIIAINGISLVGLPLASAQQNIKGARSSTAVKLTVVSTPPVVEVRIKRPDTKYQLGFSVQNGVICSLLRGGIAERGGIRVGHRIIEINSQSVVAVAHEKIVNMLATAIGEIHMKTMPTSMFRLLTGQEVPNYI